MNFAPLKDGSYDFAMFDFPWKWRNWSPTVKNRRSPEAKYKTMTMEEVARAPVRELLAPGGVAWIWCTWPLIADQSMICQNAWGLEIKTGGAWSKRTATGKLRVGTGFILRSVCEPFLIATLPGHKLKAGSRTYNLIETLTDLELPGRARQHSRKPEESYHLIEKMTPGWRRADVFARERRPGWDPFGLEVDKFSEAR